MVSVSSFVHPTEDSSSDSQESPSGSPSGGSFVGTPDCTTQDEPPVLPPSVTLSVDACFSGATVLITGMGLSDMGCPASLDCYKIYKMIRSIARAPLAVQCMTRCCEKARISCSFLYYRNLRAGVTGFVGSTVLEQLLRVCPSVKRVYVVIREKRGMTGANPLAAAGTFDSSTFQGVVI